jgi:FAD:protein FMN transferase
VQDLFARVEAACTRFDPHSPLMRANDAGEAWCEVPDECYRALSEAARAHRRTDGLFDPRVLSTLVALGYDRSLPFADGPVRVSTRHNRGNGSGRGPADVPPLPVPVTGPDRLPAWEPGFDPAREAVRIGPRAVDLGGIGKGLAVRWAAGILEGTGRAFLVEAGGDCHLGGPGPDGGGWRVGVEDPDGGPEPVAVLTLTDTGCATSSLRLRSWQVDGRDAHHLIDPRTGLSAAGGLRSVTVAGLDTATAEVWSKSLLIAGRTQIVALARQHGLGAFWVTDDGRLGCSPAMRPAMLWTASEVEDS